MFHKMFHKMLLICDIISPIHMIRLCYRFLRLQPEQTLEQTVKFTAIWDAVYDGPHLFEWLRIRLLELYCWLV